jgi:hypothetical protein
MKMRIASPSWMLNCRAKQEAKHENDQATCQGAIVVLAVLAVLGCATVSLAISNGTLDTIDRLLPLLFPN